MTRASRTAPPAPADLACACAAARQVARLLTQLYDHRLRGVRIEAPQFALLMALHKQGPSSQASLGRRHGLDKTTVSRNLKWLEQRGWIASSAAADARHRQFRLTPDGVKQLNAALPQWKKAQADLRAKMTPAQWDNMFRVFKTVTTAANVAHGDR